jgi:catechol 2,3-dioxygenase-like lactoylglutathione lyase family enzyme
VGVQRIEAVCYSVTDLDECARFFEDVGLTPVSRDATDATFETQIRQTVRLTTRADAELPAPVEPGSTLREVVWGVDTEAELFALVARAGADRPVRRDEQGIYHTVDETGFGVGLTIADPAPVEAGGRVANTWGRVGRWNTALGTVGRVRPLRICHVALNIPKAGKDEAIAFYIDRLGFIPTDIVKPMGVFMRVEGDADQHNFLLSHRPDRAGVNHLSLEVPGFDDVVEGVNYLLAQGWQEARRLGRHTVGSNVFRFVHAPCGGRVEFAADMDRVDHSYGVRVHETAPPHHIWTLRDSRDSGQDHG